MLKASKSGTKPGFIVVGLDVPLAGGSSLLLAARVGRKLVYVGRVEWGVSRPLSLWLVRRQDDHERAAEDTAVAATTL
jgi:hypothetical protein